MASGGHEPTNGLQTTDLEDQQRESRMRTLTEKASENYETACRNYKCKLNILEEKIILERRVFMEGQLNEEGLIDSDITLRKYVTSYAKTADDFMAWLSRCKTETSQLEIVKQRDLINQFNNEIENTMMLLGKKLNEYQEKEEKTKEKSISRCSRSHRSETSSNSYRSSVTSILMKKKAKAEAAKASLQYVNQEAEIKKLAAKIEEETSKHEAELRRKRQDLQIELELLNSKKEAEMAKCEYKAVQDIDISEERSSVSSTDIRERTEKFVNSVQSLHFDQIKPAESHFKETPLTKMKDVHQQEETLENTHQKSIYPGEEIQSNTYNRDPVTELSRFLLKKDMLLSRFVKFNDRPETFHTWKKSFCSITDDLHVTPFEESDLLVKWLGPKSSEYAQTIRASNISDPVLGLRRIWQRLEERYGCPEMVESSIRRKLDNFPKLNNKEREKLYDLHDILAEILALKSDIKFQQLLAYFDTSAGINPIASKLPPPIQGKWRDRASSFKFTHNVIYPPFGFFVDFIHEMSRRYNDPGFDFEIGAQSTRNEKQSKVKISSVKTQIKNQPENNTLKCIIHNSNHSVNDCRVFKSKSFDERKKLLKDNGVCFRCCNAKDHMKKECKVDIKCNECGNQFHSTAMHYYRATNVPRENYGGETYRDNGHYNREATRTVTNSCTEICGDFNGKSCAKILPVFIYHQNNPACKLKTYAILDEQSNKTLARQELLDFFDINCRPEEYTLMSCSGKSIMQGRRADGLMVQSLDKSACMKLPTVIECDEIPSNRDEIPTPEIVKYHEHLQDLSSLIEPIDDRAKILLLIGRDLMEAHHVLDQRIGRPDAPYAQKLKLGWVVVGEICLGKQHSTPTVSTCRTYIINDGRPSVLKPCPSKFTIKEQLDPFEFVEDTDRIGSTVFQLTHDDNKVGKSVEDKMFLSLMETEFSRDEDGKWCAPLPFKPGREKLPNNKPLAMKRANSLTKSLHRDEAKKQHFTDFIQKLLDNGHAEVAPTIPENQECWYLPVFGVYHPKKPGQIRCVFDSSAKFGKNSLNSVLLSGPDLNNSLIGVLMRFRKNEVAVSADIRQMFYSFTVREDHRDYLRFIWHKDNNIEKELIDYRMKVHVFGNSPSPSVAIYGLHKTVEVAEPEFGTDVKSFVERNFYVDDGLISLQSEAQAIDLLRRTRDALSEHGKLYLHKFASNAEGVMKAFPAIDLAESLKCLDLSDENLPLQRSLGLYWNLATDNFSFKVACEEKPFTRRGVLSVVNSVYDPLGFVAPITVQGKQLLRKFITGTIDWDEPLPEEYRLEWNLWCAALKDIENVHVPRMYVPRSLMDVSKKELHVFADASENAIAAVSYLRNVKEDSSSDLGFVMGKAKVAPLHGHTIPRLELCAAVMAVEMAELIQNDIDETFEKVNFYSDSKVVLGYIHNERRRFYVYVENRVQKIRRTTSSTQWSYIPTSLNPADQGTRPVSMRDLFEDGSWLSGPKAFLDKVSKREEVEMSNSSDLHNLVDPGEDKEIRPVIARKTYVESQSLGCDRFERFSSLKSLINAIVFLRHFLKRRVTGKKEFDHKNVDLYKEANQFIIKCVQKEKYRREIDCINEGRDLPRDSPILSLNPYLDREGILRVGGRLNKSDLKIQEKNPLILPGKHHISLLIVRHYHESVKHQGRHFTEGSIRSAGFWITGAKRLVSSVIHVCVKCKKLRGKAAIQLMADLPTDRIEVNPPFTNVGVDTFGPWEILTRRTRGGSANSKRWAILFTCLTTRAIHIEVVEEMSSSAFINALRRFVAIRGKVKIFRSDRGTNFIGATDDLRINAVNVEDTELKTYLYDSDTKWIFNPPYASHMGGAWERLIGVTRRILESMLSDISGKRLTHDVLVTLFAEVCAIVNNRPLVPISNDPEDPFVLSPSMLLTQKIDCFEGHSTEVDKTLNHIDTRNMLKSEWKRVQVLSDMFWSKWRREYLNTLQTRRKWNDNVHNIESGCVVILRDKSCSRNEWPLGKILRAFKSDDNKVRKVEVLVVRDNKKSIYIRPISEIIPLISNE